jgi:predicted nucleotidyltransferase
VTVLPARRDAFDRLIAPARCTAASGRGVQDICEAAERLEILPGVSVPVAQPGHLVAMKLLSRADHRLQDEIDLRNLAAVLSMADIELARLAVARIEALGANRGRELVAELARYLATFVHGSC